MGIFDGVLLCSDIDGTLVYNGNLSDTNRSMISYFMSEGGLFTVSTGRYSNYIKNTYSLDVNTGIISVNGTVISDESGNDIMYDSKLSLDLVNRIYDYVLPQYNLEHFWAADVDKMDLPFDTRTYYPANKLVLVPYDEDTAIRLMTDVQNRFDGEVNVSRSWPTGVEVIPEGSGKGYCSLLLKKMTDSKLLVCAGDNENDITMLKAADVGFAVQNAVDAAKLAADRITSANADTAIAEIIETIQREYI